jgi:hypothetical protein|tara:strand:- start:484 stop:807 length:324 start_codon:yes stop_codon:yes gene_type:complete
MLLNQNYWYFLNGYGGRTRAEVLNQNHIRLFCRKQDYDVFMLVSQEVLHKIKYEPDVAGFSIIPSYTAPYSVYTLALNTNNIQYYVDKYNIEAICQSKENKTKITLK